MKAILALVLVVAALLAVPAVSGASETLNLESPAKFMAEGAHLLSSGQCFDTPDCGQICVPQFKGAGNSDAQLFRKWLNDEYTSCGIDMHMNGLSLITHFLHPGSRNLGCLPINYPCDNDDECCSLICHPTRNVCLNVA
jgi:hypothetical protein